MKPILFNTEMVKAILDGRKTTTRRLIKGVTDMEFEGVVADNECFGKVVRFGISAAKYCNRSAPYNIGDILYVRETWADVPETSPGNIHYKASANDADLKWFEEEGWKWRPSIHMPKEYARIFLRVTDVRVERLQDCGNAQAKDEGCTGCSQFARIWDSTISKKALKLYGWEANPWVWVITFEKEDPDGK